MFVVLKITAVFRIISLLYVRHKCRYFLRIITRKALEITGSAFEMADFCVVVRRNYASRLDNNYSTVYFLATVIISLVILSSQWNK